MAAVKHRRGGYAYALCCSEPDRGGPGAHGSLLPLLDVPDEGGSPGRFRGAEVSPLRAVTCTRGERVERCGAVRVVYTMLLVFTAHWVVALSVMTTYVAVTCAPKAPLA